MMDILGDDATASPDRHRRPRPDRAAAPDEPGALETALRAARARGRKLLVPYVTGGLGADWPDVVRAVADAGADAIEIGIPFSDPVMDGPIIQEATEQALAGRGHARTASSTSCAASTPASRWR